MKHAVPSSALFLRSTFALFLSHLKTVLIASAVFALLGGVFSTFVQAGLEQVEDAIAIDLGIDWQELRVRVQEDLRILSELEPDALIALVERASPSDPSASEHIGIVYALRAGHILFLLLCGLLIVFFVARSFFFLLFTAERTGFDAAKRLPFIILGMAVLGLWIAIRSFTWIPVIGPVVGLYTLPRLSLASVYYARGGGILQSARHSWQGTRGLWLPVTLRLLLLLLVCLLSWWVLMTFISIAALFSLKLASLLGLFGFFLLTAFFVSGLTVLAR